MHIFQKHTDTLAAPIGVSPVEQVGTFAAHGRRSLAGAMIAMACITKALASDVSERPGKVVQRNPDAELISMCAKSVVHYREYLRTAEPTYSMRTGDPEEARLSIILTTMVHAWHEMLDQVSEMEAITLEGIQAKAEVAMYYLSGSADPKAEPSNPDDDSLMWSLVQDIRRRDAPEKTGSTTPFPAPRPQPDWKLLQLEKDMCAAITAEEAAWTDAGDEDEADGPYTIKALAMTDEVNNVIAEIEKRTALSSCGVLVKVRALSWCLAGDVITSDKKWLCGNVRASSAGLMAAVFRDLSAMAA